mmetsp:Transcript_25230/g.51867  ORF Transcript_25230/g.51867 Transcript_25230/m.51867 type:complete len:229 (-) Transcript_25230:899-1585(-)
MFSLVMVASAASVRFRRASTSSGTSSVPALVCPGRLAGTGVYLFGVLRTLEGSSNDISDALCSLDVFTSAITIHVERSSSLLMFCPRSDTRPAQLSTSSRARRLSRKEPVTPFFVGRMYRRHLSRSLIVDERHSRSMRAPRIPDRSMRMPRRPLVKRSSLPSLTLALVLEPLLVAPVDNASTSTDKTMASITTSIKSSNRKLLVKNPPKPRFSNSFSSTARLVSRSSA